MVGDPFYGAIGAAVVDTEHGAARHQAHVRQACEFVNNASRPDMARAAADFLAFCKQPAAKTEVLITDDDARTRTRRHQCRCQTRRARTGPQFHERVRLLGARAQYAPGTMILEAASDNTRAFREQRGRQRISGTARGRFPVEAKTKRLRAVDEAAARQPEGLGATHGPAAP